jgi:hypothetical protein
VVERVNVESGGQALVGAVAIPKPKFARRLMNLC